MALATVLAAGAMATAAAGDMIMEVVPLKHRPPDQVVPVLRELVAPGGVVTGVEDRLVIRTTPENLAELKTVLASLDTRLKQLRISVTQDIAAHSQMREQELSARLRHGDAEVGVGGPDRGPGASISLGDGNSRLRHRSYSTRSEDDRASTHFVSAVEGEPAFIAMGRSVPLPAQSAVLTPYGAAVQHSLEYRDVGSGFYVVPRLAGDRVHLEISPFAERQSPGGGGAIDAHGLATTASGRLGEWIPLGGAAEGSSQAGDGVAYSTRRRDSDVYDVWVKVEVVP